jgi:hypothetical protein
MNNTFPLTDSYDIDSGSVDSDILRPPNNSLSL